MATGTDILEAYNRAYETDPTSAFGGIIAFNRKLDMATARTIIERQFVEVIIAPEVDVEAAAILQDKQNIRVLSAGQLPEGPTRSRISNGSNGGPAGSGFRYPYC